MSQTHLYRHFDCNGALLYVGISCNPLSRTSQHKYGADWFDEIANITIESFETREEALKAELLAIRTENPKCNIAGVKKEEPKSESPQSEEKGTYSFKIIFGKWFVKVEIVNSLQKPKHKKLGWESKGQVEPKWHTVTESAKLAGVSRRTVQRYMRAEKIPSKLDRQGNPKIHTNDLRKAFPSVELTA